MTGKQNVRQRAKALPPITDEEIFAEDIADAASPAEQAKIIRERKREIERLNKLVSSVMRFMKPPEKITVSEWADKYRRLSPESSAEVGPWRTTRTPYLRGPMDAFCDPKVNRIVLVSASQIGKSELLNNILGYIIDVDPASVLFIHPQVIAAKEYSHDRIEPMIRDCPTLRRKVAPPKSRDSGNTILRKSFPGGQLTFCGSTEAYALASKPIRYLLCDERDRWAASAGKEGDPMGLALARQITFYNAKCVEVSTPTVKGHSAIADSFALGTQERWCVQCPHCGEYFDVRFEHIRYKTEQKVVGGKIHRTPRDVQCFCPECGCISDEQTMKRQPAKWIAGNPDAYIKGVRSFWLNAFVSPWASWQSIVQEYLDAYGNSQKLQVVYNTRFGELWEDRAGTIDEDIMLERREDYDAELPVGVLVLTAGIDTQDNRMEYEIVGHGHFGETWGIEKGVIMGRPDDAATWAKLDEMVFDRVLHFADGIGLRVSISFVDQAGHYAGEVRQQCALRIGKNVFAIMGSTDHNAPYTRPPKRQKILIDGQYIGTCWMCEIGVDAGKQRIMDNLKVTTPGKNFCHFPRRDDYGPDYFNGLLSERLEYDASKKQPWAWRIIPGHERNEALDCRNYALAAMKSFSVNLDAVDAQLLGLRSKKKQGDERRVDTPSPAEKSAPRPRRRGNIYDEW